MNSKPQHLLFGLNIFRLALAYSFDHFAEVPKVESIMRLSWDGEQVFHRSFVNVHARRNDFVS